MDWVVLSGLSGCCCDWCCYCAAVCVYVCLGSIVIVMVWLLQGCSLKRMWRVWGNVLNGGGQMESQRSCVEGHVLRLRSMQYVSHARGCCAEQQLAP